VARRQRAVGWEMVAASTLEIGRRRNGPPATQGGGGGGGGRRAGDGVGRRRMRGFGARGREPVEDAFF
jgi:hypothetical protein